MLASEHILKIVESYGDQTAQIDAETRRTLKFNEIRRKSNALTKWLLAHNLGKGDIIGFMNQNNVDYIWILLGVWNSGAACYLIDAKYTLREVQHSLSMVPVECLIVQKGGFQKLLCDETSKLKFILEFGDENTQSSEGAIKLEDVLNFDTDQQMPIKMTRVISDRKKSMNNPDDLALILNSSGSTGLPKGVMITHGNILSALKLRGRFIDKRAKALGLMPYHHAYGLVTMLMCLCEGVLVVNMAHFSLSPWIKVIKEFSLSHLHIVPSLALSLAKSDTINFQDLISIRHVWLAAAPICKKSLEELMGKFLQRVTIHKCFGLTETTYVVIDGEFDLKNPGYIGKVVEGMQLKIIDPDSRQSLPASSIGELCIKGPMLTKGYLNNPQATSLAIYEDGWFRTGDLCYMDEEGHIYYTERIKQIIKYQGHQISPCELEAVLTSHPEIAEAAVIGVSHEIFGEVPRAFVIRSERSNITAQEIHAYVKEMVAPYKILRGGVVFPPSLPKIGPSKIDRNCLRTQKPDTVFYDQSQ